jgi:hypothetical protein
VIVRPALRVDAEEMARVHLLSSNAAYRRDDDYDRRLAGYRENVLADPEVRPFLAEDDRHDRRVALRRADGGR